MYIKPLHTTRAARSVAQLGTIRAIYIYFTYSNKVVKKLYKVVKKSWMLP